MAAGAIALSGLIRRSKFGLQLRAWLPRTGPSASASGRCRSSSPRSRSPAPITALACASGATSSAILLPAFAFDPLFDLALALMAFLGGLGTVSGPVLGALVLEPSQMCLTARLTTAT